MWDNTDVITNTRGSRMTMRICDKCGDRKHIQKKKYISDSEPTYCASCYRKSNSTRGAMGYKVDLYG